MQDSKSEESESQSDQEMISLLGAASFLGMELNVSMKSQAPSSRGPRPIPPQWSRIVDLDELGDEEHKGYEIEEDINALEEE